MRWDFAGGILSLTLQEGCFRMLRLPDRWALRWKLERKPCLRGDVGLALMALEL